MAELTLKRIQLRNWTTVRSAELELPACGLILLIGSNLAAEGKLQSVGSGKTSLGEALARALAGVRGRFTDLGQFTTDGSKEGCYVKVEAELQSQPFTVEMGYKCPELNASGEGFKFSALMGELLADLAEGAEPDPDVASFGLARFAEGASSRPALGR